MSRVPDPRTRLELTMADSSASVLSPQILGPHPGLFIFRIWQGVVEVILRIVLAVFSLCTLTLPAALMNEVSDNIPSENSLKHDSRAAGLFLICFASLALTVEVVILVLRFLNIGAINLQMKKFFIVDIAVSIVLAVGFVTAGLTQVVYANKWRDAPSSCVTNNDRLCKDYSWWKLASAAAVSCFVCAVLAVVLSIWSLLFLIKRWYYKMLQYITL